ncbi:M23 family metallopeptidase [Campylobacter sp. VBCF_05 NA6]|uniref:M23 family metallopeptidase n=1 Tax=unclassified Campylobacter TaxID=2593542 RepID=UPI0022E9E4DE|nr:MULTISPECIES: M23 family metallopeptidase [unclassified Campylobacter]MDA3058076.1 M23 family metallopeptidase [Campylobacter sp. VBCF_04 NA7]MDA3059369.1 M23 family metallopeptidase [Campylobacter sp. VBCF_05 NA6]
MYRNRSRINPKIFIFLILTLAIAYGVFHFLTSPKFEQNPPKIEIADEIYWNLISPLKVKISDDTGVKSIKVSLNDGENLTPLKDEEYGISQKELEVAVEFPKNLILNKDKKYKLHIEAGDISAWNFTKGNKTDKVVNIIIDNKKPLINLVANSYKITKGGSAVVVFSASDEMLDEVFIRTNYGKIFKATPFVKEGYYASLVAWPANEDEFRAEIVATDKAGNVSSSQIRYFYSDKKYKVSQIKLSENFLSGKVSDLASQHAQNFNSMSDLDKFKFVNETLREQNAKDLHAFTSRVHEDMISEFSLRPFYPLAKGAAVASFADHRLFFLNSEQVSESWHMGLDLASVANADIKESNYGVVVFLQDNGIYGLNLGVYYGFGVYGVYAHCSNSALSVGDQVKPNDILAQTGATGFAFGDHLHFGIVVQGVEVRPEEWMDPKWIKDNVSDVLESAKKVIEKGK